MRSCAHRPMAPRRQRPRARPRALRFRGARVFDQGGSHGSCRYRFGCGCGYPHEIQKAQGGPRGFGQAACALGGRRRPRRRRHPGGNGGRPCPRAGHPAGRGRHAGSGAGSAERHGGRGARLRRRLRRLRRLAVGSHRRLPAHQARDHRPSGAGARREQRRRGGAHHEAGRSHRLRSHHPRRRRPGGAHRRAEGRHARGGGGQRVQLRLLLLRRACPVRCVGPGQQQQRPGRVLSYRRA